MTNFNSKQVQILQVAEKLFAEKGFDGTSIREISKEAQINIAMVSYYFGSKEKLLESMILFRTLDLKMQLKSIFDEESTPIEKIEKFIELLIQKMDSNRDLYQILHVEISSKKRATDMEAFIKIKKSNLLSLTKIIEDGQSQDIFRKDISIPLITPVILGTYFNFYSNRPFFAEVLGLDTDDKFDHYIKHDLTNHIQRTIKSLLLYEN